MDNKMPANEKAGEIAFGKPIPSGIKLFFADAGISTAVGFVIGMLFGAAGVTKAETFMYPMIIIGLLASFYSAFLLYKRYSQENSALIALIVTSLISYAISFPSSSTVGFSKTVSALAMLATIIGYGIGWYLAKNTQIKMFLFGRKWVIAFVVIGAITEFFQLIGLISFLAK